MPSHNRKYYRINEIDSRGGGIQVCGCGRGRKREHGKLVRRGHGQGREFSQ